MTVEYREITRFPGYRFGNDGTAWTRWRARSREMHEWHELKPSSLPTGHLRVSIRTGSRRGLSIGLHCLVLEAFVGPCPPGLECCHEDGNPKNNRVSNLRWDTRSSNIADALRHGTFVVGSRHPGAKLSEEDAKEIIRLNSIGLTQRAISERFGIAQQRVSKLLSGLTWKHVPRLGPSAPKLNFRRGFVAKKSTKLTPEKVREVRRLVGEGLSQREAGKRVGISGTVVFNIVHGNIWKHVG